jgi:hypothetical protein
VTAHDHASGHHPSPWIIEAKSTNHLLSVPKEVPAFHGMEALGEGHDSSGSELIISAADRGLLALPFMRGFK